MQEVENKIWMPIDEVAKEFGIHPTTINKIWRR
jgi:predicted transcriptional regulator